MVYPKRLGLLVRIGILGFTVCLATIRRRFCLPYTLVDREVLAHFARGKSNAGIAEALGVGRVTVRNAIYRVLDKLGVESNRETLVWAVQNGLLEVEEGRGRLVQGARPCATASELGGSSTTQSCTPIEQEAAMLLRR